LARTPGDAGRPPDGAPGAVVPVAYGRGRC
jgi:hypothetical protein